MWETAYKNSKYIKPDGLNYVRVCKFCNEQTNYKLTQERQQLGNVIQIIAKCSCKRLFVYEQPFH